MIALLEEARALTPITFADGSVLDPGKLVSGREFRTALALERRGLGRVRYQGPNLGWFQPTDD